MIGPRVALAVETNRFQPADVLADTAAPKPGRPIAGFVWRGGPPPAMRWKDR